MIDLMDNRFSDKARLYFRSYHGRGITQEGWNQFAGRVNAINAILGDDCVAFKQALADSGLSTQHDFNIFQFTHIPNNPFAPETNLKVKVSTNFLEIAKKAKASQCVAYLDQYNPEKKRRSRFRRR